MGNNSSFRFLVWYHPIMFFKNVFKKMGMRVVKTRLLVLVFGLTHFKLSEGRTNLAARIRVGGQMAAEEWQTHIISRIRCRKYLHVPKAGCFDGKLQWSKPWEGLEFVCSEILEGCALIILYVLHVWVLSVNLGFANWCNVFYLAKHSIGPGVNTAALILVLPLPEPWIICCPGDTPQRQISVQINCRPLAVEKLPFCVAVSLTLGGYD